MKCEVCGATEGVQLEGSRTCYPIEEPGRYKRLVSGDSLASPPDPNAPIALCRDCAKDHHEFWDEQWQNYYSGLL